MEFIKSDVNIDFIGKKNLAFSFSIALIVITIISLFYHNGPKYGIDFAGGTVIQVKFGGEVAIDKIKEGLAGIDITKTTVQKFGDSGLNEFLVHTDESLSVLEGFTDKLQQTLEASTGSTAEIRRIEMVGPTVGKDLRKKALFAMFYALLFITIYISGRFQQEWMKSAVIVFVISVSVYGLSQLNVSVPFLMLAALIISLILFWIMQLKYAMGAIVALIHDVTITVGVFSICDKEFTLPIIAALLTIIGYSLNDTIIVFDRIRENLKKYHKNPLETIINKSINETLSRTILTSGTTLLVLIFLFIFGGGIIHDFAFAMIAGIFVGTYSSIYVASPFLIAWQGKRKK